VKGFLFLTFLTLLLALNYFYLFLNDNKNNKTVATKDNLTQIDDRESFYKKLTKQIHQANIHQTKLALILVDIDHFYSINDFYGYHDANKILVKFVELLKTVARPQDYIARIGDNTFAIILNGIMNVGHAELAAHKISRLLETPFTLHENKILIRCSMGISVCPTHAKNERYLLKEAETVLRKTKAMGVSIGVSEFKAEDEISDTWDIEMDLSMALDNSELYVYYQPKVSTKTGQITGAEALLRWIHPKRGFISPDVFIPLAEKSGVIKPITNWVLNTVLRQAAEWTDKWGKQSISVNIPPEFILFPEFKDTLQNALNLWGTTNITLTLEIIERSLITEVNQTISVLKDIRAMGIDISIDDFGTGYSSLSYFEKLPVNELKIDMSFICNLLKSKPNRDIVRFVINLAQAFDLKIVAEGVEDVHTLKYLKKLECDLIQGYYFSKPLSHEQYSEYLMNFELVDIEKLQE